MADSTNPIYKAIAGMDLTKSKLICEHGIYAAGVDSVLFTTAPAAAEFAAKFRCVTRRQAQLVKLLNDGWVFELMKPALRLSKRTGRPLHQPASRLYLMRGPQSQETDGPVVTAKTVDSLIELGFAVRVTHQWADRTWVYSRSNYEKSPMGQAPPASPSSQTSAPSASSTSSSSRSTKPPSST